MNFYKCTSVKAVGIFALATAAVIICLASTSPNTYENSQRTPAGPLDYRMGSGGTANPWIILACRWPSMEAANLAVRQRTPPPGAREHFARWVKASVGGQWLPGGFPEDIPYLDNWGFISVKETEDYRVRVREATKPAYSGSSIMTKAILIAVEPMAGQILTPQTQDTMPALLGQFLGPEVPISTAEDKRIPRFREQSGAYFLARCPVGSRLALQLYAWSDGNILLIAIYEDVNYSSGPTSTAQVEPVEQGRPYALRVRFLQPEAHPSMPDWVESFAATLDEGFVQEHRVEVSQEEKAQALQGAQAILNKEWLPPEALEKVVMLDDWPAPNSGNYGPGDLRPAPLAYDVAGFRCLLYENNSDIYFFIEQQETAQKSEGLKAAVQGLLGQVLVEGLVPTARHISYEHSTDYLRASCLVPEGPSQDLVSYMAFWFDGSALGLLIGK